MASLTKQISAWLSRFEVLISKREHLSVELRDGGRVRETLEWDSMEVFLAANELRDEMTKLAALDRLSRHPPRDTDDPETKLAALIEQRDALLRSAKHLVGTALELSIMISALEQGLPRGPRKLGKARRKRIKKHIAELEAVCQRQRAEYIEGFSAA